jgi:hypothetical protein
MKFSKLLVMSALLLMCGKAMAALDGNGRRIAPEPTATQFTVGSTEEVYYLYNTSAKMFFTQGNTWGTRGCVGPAASATKIYFSEYSEDQYVLNDYVCVRSTSYSWKVACADDDNNVYTDQSTGWGHPFWNIEVNEENGTTFRLHNTFFDANLYMGRNDAVAQDFGNAYSGFTDDKQRFPVSPNLAEGAGNHIDWVLVSEADYQDNVDMWPAYEAAEALYVVIEEAEQLGNVVGLVEAKALYADETATVEDLQAATKDLEEAVKERKNNQALTDMMSATGADPKDASFLIINPAFDGGDLTTGWSGTAFGAYNGKDNAEHYEKTYNSYQDITIPATGLYVVSVNAFYRAGSTEAAYDNFVADNEESHYARFYVTFDELESEIAIQSPYEGAPTKATGKGSETSAGGFFVPNNMEAAEYYMHTLKLYNNMMPVELTEGTTLRIGVKKETTISMDWSIFDDFAMVFCGNGDDKYVGYAKIYADRLPSYADAVATQSYLDAYLQKKANPAATNQDEAETYIAELKAVRAALDKNIALWAQYNADVEAAREFVKEYGTSGNQYVGKLNGYLSQMINPMPNYFPNGSAVYILQNMNLDNAAIEAEIAFIAKMKQDVLDNVEIVPPFPMTNHLTNPAFETNDWTGWTHKAASGGNVRVAEHCCEAWNNASFDIYQEVSDMPVGVYEISVQGFYRYGRNNAWNDYNNGNAPEKSPTYIYMNDNTTSFTNIFGDPQQITDEGFYAGTDGQGNVLTGDNRKSTDYNSNTGADNVVYWFPNGMASSAIAFDAGMYTQSAYGAIFSADEIMRLGVKGSSNQLGDSWVIFDNFKLTYWGTQVDKVAEALEAVMPEVKELQAGRMSSNVRQAINDAITNAEAAEKAQDGAAMFAALKDLYSAKAKVMESKARMDNLAAVADTLNNLIADVPQDWSFLTQLTEAGELYESINTALDPAIGQGISDEEVDAKLDELHASMETVQSIIDLAAAYDELVEAIASASDDVSESWMLEAYALQEDVEGKRDNDEFDNGEFVVYKEKIEYMIATMNINRDDMANATDAAPYDATNVIKTPNFEKVDEFDPEIVTNSIEGWKGTDGYNFGNDDTQKKALAVEFFHKAFDLHQELLGLPAGTYEVKADAFQRLDNATSQSALLYAQVKSELGEIDNHVMLKQLLDGGQVDSLTVEEEVEDPETGDMVMQPVLIGSQVKTVIDEATGEFLWVPNDMVSSAAYFKLATKPYQNSVIAQIAEGDTLRIGIRTEDANTWIIMDNFELWYYGANSSKQASGDTTVGIDKLGGEKAVATVVRNEFFTVDGVRTMVLRKGIYVVRQTMSDGSVVVKKVTLK